MMHDKEVLLASGYKAFTYSDGTILTFNSNSIVDSFDDQPSRVVPDGSCYWHQDGILHREGGPAAVVVCDGGRVLTTWRRHGRLHRTDGPAFIYDDGKCEWWVDGVQHQTTTAYQQAADLSDEQMIVLVLQHGEVC